MSNLEKINEILCENHSLIKIHSYHKVELKHDCGNIYFKNMNEIKKGSFRCNNCYIRGNPIPLKQLVTNEDSEYELVGKFTKMHDKVAVKHLICGESRDITLYSFLTLHGSRCDCKTKSEENDIDSSSFSKYLKLFYKNDFDLVDSKILDKRCGHTYITDFKDFITSTKICKVCENKDYYKNVKKSDEQVQFEIDLLTNKSYSLLSPYINNKTKVNILHKTCNTEFEVRINDFISAGNRCPHCKKGKKVGNRFIKIINELKNTFDTIEEVKFNDCVYKRKLPFDMGILKDNKIVLLLEFNGDQHYKNSFGDQKKFEDQQKRDAIKKKYAEDNGIPLLIIPYNTKLSIEEIISKAHNMI